LCNTGWVVPSYFEKMQGLAFARTVMGGEEKLTRLNCRTTRHLQRLQIGCIPWGGLGGDAVGRIDKFFTACCTATRLGTRRRLQCVAGVLVFVWWIGPSTPAQAADIEDVAALPSLPWSALPPQPKEHPHPLYLVIPRLPIAVQSDPSLNALSDEGTTTAVGTTLWSSDYGDARLGISIGEVEDDHPIGENERRYTAIFAFDQPLGFSTALSVDVLFQRQTTWPEAVPTASGGDLPPGRHWHSRSGLRPWCSTASSRS
jgi:hypothetical protein